MYLRPSVLHSSNVYNDVCGADKCSYNTQDTHTLLSSVQSGPVHYVWCAQTAEPSHQHHNTTVSGALTGDLTTWSLCDPCFGEIEKFYMLMIYSLEVV